MTQSLQEKAQARLLDELQQKKLDLMMKLLRIKADVEAEYSLQLDNINSDISTIETAKTDKELNPVWHRHSSKY